ncbi:MAG: TRAP transporter small permease [Candidatus Thiodiazotropha sp. (ex Ctena orbiculata)]|nr:TRAP transporter small permease [Candidatus Thiodiazotropha taylori]
MINKLQTIRQVIHRFEEFLTAILLGGMILLAGSQIVLRNLFDSGLIWADPSLRIMVLWIALLGAIAATRENRHIRIDLLSHVLSKRSQSLLTVVHDLFSALVCGLIAWHSARFVYFEWQDGTQLFSILPAWIGEIIIPIGFTIMTIRFIVNIPLHLMNRKSA